MFRYYRWCWYNSHRVDECSNAFSLLHYTVSKQEHPWNLLATIYVERRREILKRWLYLKTSANLTQQYILGLILKISHVVESSANKKVLQASQTNITYFTCEFGDVYIYRSLLKVFLLHSTDLMLLSVRAQGKTCYIEVCGCHTQHLLQLSWGTGLL